MNPIKLPRIKLDEIDNVYIYLHRLFDDYHGQPLSRDSCHRLADLICSSVRPFVALDSEVAQTILQYEGRVLSARASQVIVRQLAARIDDLRKGPLQPFERPIRDEWVPMEVERMEPCLWKEEDEGYILHLFCLAGHPSGHLLQKKVPETWLAWLAYQIGFSRRLPYTYEPEMFIGLRFWGYLLAEESEGHGILNFEKWDISPALRKYNRVIILRRSRLDLGLDDYDEEGRKLIHSCPFDFEHYCSDCSVDVNDCVASYNRDLRSEIARDRREAGI